MTKYLDLTKPEDFEPTYSRAQWIAGGILVAAMVGVIIFGTLSLISAL